MITWTALVMATSTVMPPDFASREVGSGDQVRETARVTLDWQAPPECMAAEELETRVEERLGRVVFEDEAQLRLRGDIDETGRSARLILTDEQGETLGSRELSVEELEPGGDCRSLDEALVLVVGLMIDLEEQRRASDADRTSEPSAPPSASVEPAAAEDERPPLDETDRPRISGRSVGIELGPRAILGEFSNAVLGLSLTATLDAFWPLGLDLEASLPRTLDVSPEAPGETRFSLFGIGVFGCPLHMRGSIAEGGLCGGLRGGLLLARSSGFVDDRNPARPFFEPLVRSRVVLRISDPVELVAGAEVGLPVIRDRFNAENERGDTETVSRSQVFSGRFDLSVRLRFDAD